MPPKKRKRIPAPAPSKAAPGPRLSKRQRLDNDIQRLEQEIKEVQKEIKDVEEKVRKLEKDIADVDEEIKSASERDASELQEGKKRLQNEKEQLREKELQLREEKRQLREQQRQLREEKLQIPRQIPVQEGTAAVPSSSKRQRVDNDIQQEIDRVQKEIEDVQKKLRNVEKDITDVDEEIKSKSKRDASELRKKRCELQEEEKSLQDKKEQLREQQRQLREEKLLYLRQKLLQEGSIAPTSGQNLEAMQKEIGAASSFAKIGTWPDVQKRLQKKRCPLKCHRPGDMYGTDVTLFYPGFDKFVEQCKSVVLENTDTTFVTKLSIALSKNYVNEMSRNSTIKSILNEYLIRHRIISADNTDSAVIYGNVYGFILETKNEVGTGGCDSCMEAVAHYAKLLKPGVLIAPCFLMEVIGVHMCIYGAVFTGAVCVDRLTNCLWLAFQPNNRPAMGELARTLKALRMALDELKAYYRENVDGSPPKQGLGPFFRTYFDEHEGNDVEIEYMGEIKNHVYSGNTSTNKRVVVKFVERYGENAHKACSDAGFAPALLSCKRVTSRFYMVVMEELEDATVLTTYIQQCNKEEKRLVIDQCDKALTALHSEGFCHGDFRTNNILVRQAEHIQIWVIDFDWSGKIGETTYPLFMNHVNIKWHQDASDGKLLRAEHDTYWLEKLNMDKWDTDSPS